VKAQDSAMATDSTNFPLQKAPVHERTIFSDSITKLQKDTAQNKDSVFADSVLPAKPIAHLNWETDTVWQNFIRSQLKEPNNKPVFLLNEKRIPNDKTGLFYLLLGNIFLLAVLKNAFPKYYKRILGVFFNASVSFKSLQDAIYQNRLPSLLFNILFAFSTAIFVAFLSQQYHWVHLHFWQVLGYSFLFILIIYTGKYVFVSFLGWLFRQQSVSELYLYLVFLLNKALGILLVPCLWFIAFGGSNLAYVGTLLAIIFIGIIWLRRYILSFRNLKKSLSFQPLHFFIYLCGVEILPLLVIIKGILDFLNQQL
jgi:hypothetical protein